jgi:hypothetical protein
MRVKAKIKATLPLIVKKASIILGTFTHQTFTWPFRQTKFLPSDVAAAWLVFIFALIETTQWPTIGRQDLALGWPNMVSSRQGFMALITIH